MESTTTLKELLPNVCDFKGIPWNSWNLKQWKILIVQVTHKKEYRNEELQSTFWASVGKSTITNGYLKFTGIDISEVCYTKQEAMASDIDIKEFTMQQLVASSLEGPLLSN